MTVQNLPPMHMLTRARGFSEPTVSANINIFPREVVESNPEVLEAYDRFVNARTARTDAYRNARKLRDQAETERAEFQAKVREAVSSGADTSKLKNPYDRLIAEAEAFEAVGRSADGQLLALGRQLGRSLSEHAEALFPASEDAYTAAAERLRADLEAVKSSWRDLAAAWQIRRTILSAAALYGGSVSNYDPNPRPPKEIADAITSLLDSLNDLDRLKADEAHIREWREHNTHAGLRSS